jgi:hypothetical protein
MRSTLFLSSRENDIMICNLSCISCAYVTGYRGMGLMNAVKYVFSSSKHILGEENRENRAAGRVVMFIKLHRGDVASQM